jgi:hypothetical protein
MRAVGHQTAGEPSTRSIANAYQWDGVIAQGGLELGSMESQLNLSTRMQLRNVTRGDVRCAHTRCHTLARVTARAHAVRVRPL